MQRIALLSSSGPAGGLSPAATAVAPPGGMLAVHASVAELIDYLDERGNRDGIVVGARNAPRQTVLAG